MPAPAPDAAVRWRRAPTALARYVAGGVALLDGAADPAGGPPPIVLDGPGAALWEELALPATRAELAARLARRHPGDPDAIATDLEPLLDDLRARNLVVPA